MDSFDTHVAMNDDRIHPTTKALILDTSTASTVGRSMGKQKSGLKFLRFDVVVIEDDSGLIGTSNGGRQQQQQVMTTHFAG